MDYYAGKNIKLAEKPMISMGFGTILLKIGMGLTLLQDSELRRIFA
jgi:hypothetical protein